MRFLKGLAISLLSFLLFLSLTIFGLALLLNNTILSPKFITSELDTFDVSSLAEEIISEQILKEEFSEGLRTALVDTIPKVEPLVKEQISAATYSIFDYLLGKRQSPELAHTLRTTILSSDFIISLVDELDIVSLAGETLGEQLAEEIPEGMEFMTEAIDDTLVELEPWVKEQISIAADPVLDYLLGESQHLNVVISTEPLTDSLKDNMWQALLESPPPELAGLPPAMIEEQFDEMFQEFSEMIPATFEINQSLLGTEMPTTIAEGLAVAEEGLEPVRQVISYFQLGYKLLIVFILLLIAGIILINRQVKGAARGVGATFLSYGVLWYAGTSIAKHFAAEQLTQIPPAEMPTALQTWLLQSIDNFLAPLEMFSLGLLVGGIALIVISFVYKPRQPSM